MEVQVRQDTKNRPFILDSGLSLKKAVTLLQDAGRTTVLAQFTLMAKISATGKWVPFTSELAVDGTAQPRGIYIGPDIAAADLVAGDVEDASILLGGAGVGDKNRIVIENAKTLGTVIGAATVGNKTVEDALNEIGIFLGESEDSTSFET